MTDSLRNRLVDVLIAETGQPPTSAALEVITEVVRETIHTDKVFNGELPTFNRYALDAERALRIKRKYR